MSTHLPSLQSAATRVRHYRSSRGAALVIVLAFVVLLTGLVVAFFSRAVAARQVSNGSINQMKAGVFAQGAIATILGDLRQEIYAGSTEVKPATTGAPTLYLPKPGDGKVPSTLLPARVGGPPAGNKINYANLVKRSAYDKAFYPGESYAATNYINTTAGVKRASNVSSLSVSQNFRAMTPARWNAPLLLPKAAQPITTPPYADDASPDGAALGGVNGAAFKWDYAPDWILVARNGSNPILTGDTFAGGSAALKWGATSDTSVVGRYAYNIYDEGGLLDMNAAGSPIISSVAATGTNFATFPTYKGGLAYADLTQLKGPDGKQCLSQTQIDQIAAWRSVATVNNTIKNNVTFTNKAYLGGFLPTYTWNDTARQAYFGFASFGNLTGYITPNSTTLTGTGSSKTGLSDNLFTTRQGLIQMMMQVIADADNKPSQADVPTEPQRSNAQNALQYLTHFSRDLNQPSLVPDPNRPKVVAGPAGGGNDGFGKDNDINPNFTDIRVTKTTFLRSDGTTAAAGEPLVKKRFPLQRLAWLTYLGPSADRTIPTTQPAETDKDYDMWTLGQYGFTKEFLQDKDTGGTAANIKKYFGLTWSGGGWVYNVHNGGGAIKKLKDIRDDATRTSDDPDFVELLQAAINVGSIAKGAVSADKLLYGKVHTRDFDFDTSTGYAIIQILANIIDQYDCDGYPTKITYGPQEIYGVENLPYVYRVHPGFLKLRESTPPTDTSTRGAKSSFPNTTEKLQDMGLGLWMGMPEIWNPHDKDCSLGAPRPTNFGVFTEGTGSNNVALPEVWSINDIDTGGSRSNSSGHSASTPKFGTGFGGAGVSIATSPGYVRPAYAESNTLMTFDVPKTNYKDMYREPTLLAKVGVPTGSNLKLMDLSSFDGGKFAKVTADKGGTPAYTVANGFVSATPNPLRLVSGEPGYSTSTGDAFIGFPGGLFPLRWVDSSGNVKTVWTTQVPNNRPSNVSTVVMECKDPNGDWIKYDHKDMSISRAWLYPPHGTAMPHNTSGGNDQSALIQFEAEPNLTFDPRTSRFGTTLSDHGNDASHAPIPGPQNYKAPAKGGWIDSGQMIRTTDRPDATAGYGAFGRLGQGTDTWQGQARSALVNLGWHVFGPSSDGLVGGAFPRFGLLSQNSPYVSAADGQRFAGDASPIAGGDPQFYADPDGVVRRGMGGYAQAGSTVGLPMARTVDFSKDNAPPGSGASRATQNQSRPWILNRPFRSVGELSYVFSGTPWRNLDFSTSESGFNGLVDVFSLTDTQDSQGLIAGRVSINTRQKPVLKTLLSSAYKDDKDPTGSGQLTPAEADAIVNALYDRTTSLAADKGPVLNLSQLLGKWNVKTAIKPTATPTGAFTPALSTSFNTDGAESYKGSFNDDLTNILTVNTDKSVGRFREAAIRPLLSASSTRVWNLMIDVVAQTGRYPTNAVSTRQFTVEGERRFWVHVAIDRMTGDVIDQEIEAVNE